MSKKSLILSSLACVLCNCSNLQIKTIKSLDNFNWVASKTLLLKLFSPRFQIATFKHLKCRSDKTARRHYEIKFHCFQIISLGFFPLYKSSILSKIFIKNMCVRKALSNLKIKIAIFQSETIYLFAIIKRKNIIAFDVYVCVRNFCVSYTFTHTMKYDEHNCCCWK